MYTLYLVGQIAPNPETYAWRDRVECYFADNDMVQTINPCNKEFNRKALAKEDDFSKTLVQKYTNVLVPQDRYYVKKANWIFANMNIYTESKPILGSFFELAWAFDQPWTTVVGIHEDFENAFQCNHPFVRMSVHTWVKDEMEACKVMKEYT